MSLHTGKRIHSYHWDKLPIPDEVIDRVEELAKLESQPLLTNKQPMFEWSPGVPITSSSIDDISDLPQVSDTLLLDDNLSSDAHVPQPQHKESLNDISFSTYDANEFFPEEHALVMDSDAENSDDLSYSSQSQPCL